MSEPTRKRKCHRHYTFYARYSFSSLWLFFEFWHVIAVEDIYDIATGNMNAPKEGGFLNALGDFVNGMTRL